MNDLNNETDNQNTVVQAEVNVNQKRNGSKTIVIKETTNKIIVFFIVFLILLFSFSLWYLFKESKGNKYSINELSEQIVLIDQVSGTVYFPETGVMRELSDYSKKREGKILPQKSITIPGDNNLVVDTQVKTTEDTALYLIEMSLSKISGSSKTDEIINKLVNSSNSCYVWLNFYDSDNFYLFSSQISLSNSTRHVDSAGYGTGLALEGSISENPSLVGLASSFTLTWSSSLSKNLNNE